MSRFWKVAAVIAVVGIVGAATLAVVVAAQEPAQAGQGWFSDFRQEMHAAIAKALGIDVSKYEAAVTQARDEVLDNAVQAGKLTQDQADRIRERAEQGLGPGIMGGRGRGLMRGYGVMMAAGQDSLIEVAADKLGMTVAEVRTELQAGKTIAALAQDKGVDVQTIIDAFLAGRQEWLDQAVADGRLTQAQADQMLANMRETVTGHVNGTLPLPGLGQGGCPMFDGGQGRRGMPGGMMNGSSGRTF